MRNNLFVLTLALSLFLIGCNDGGGGNGMDSDAAMGMDGGMVMMDAATGSDASQDAGPACQVVKYRNNQFNYFNASGYDEAVTSITIPTGCAVTTTTVSLYRDSTKIQDLGALPFSGSVILVGATLPASDAGTATNVYSIRVTGVDITRTACAPSYTVCQ